LTRIIVTSDLHLGITPPETVRHLADDIAAEGPDLTVIAGDVGERLTNFVACVELFRDVPGEVAVLSGNHDVWARGGHASQDLWERDLPTAVRAAGMLWLEDLIWRSGGVAIVGSLAWYDYSAVDPGFADVAPDEFAARKGEFNLDARFVNWPWSDLAFAQNLGDALCARLEACERDPSAETVVLVTHVPLFEEQLLRKPEDPRWGYTNAYFGNLTLGRRVLAASKVRAVVSGHTHVGRQGLVRRAEAQEGGDVPVLTLASDYHKPVYQVIDTDELG
jgi:3',5'-cyclic AMP phosphodiesterase CpdA